ncbi:MAG: hypothetical protein ACRKFN_10790 [Desulfitobacterium sp.]
MQLVLDQYECKFRNSSKDCSVAEILHWKTNASGGANITPVGHLIITKESGSETFLPHYSIQLFLRNDVRYEIESRSTIVVANPQGQAGPNKSLLKYLVGLKEGNLPYYHPRLPDEILNYLLDKGICDKPIGMNIFHYSTGGFRELGQLWDDTDY